MPGPLDYMAVRPPLPASFEAPQIGLALGQQLAGLPERFEMGRKDWNLTKPDTRREFRWTTSDDHGGAHCPGSRGRGGQIIIGFRGGNRARLSQRFFPQAGI